MKRYLLFAFEAYEGSGGWEHFTKSFDTVEEAKEQPTTYCSDKHIVDITIGAIVWSAYKDRFGKWQWKERKPE